MRHAARDDRDELDEPSRVVVEPGGAPEHGVRDRRRQLGGRPRREQLGDVERVAAASRRRRRRRRPRRATRPRRFESGASSIQTESSARDRAECSAERVGRRHLAAAEGEHEQRRKRRDPAAEHRDRVERRLVGPVDVLEHEHRRPRRPLQLGDQQALDLVRRGARVRARSRARPRRRRRGRGSGRADAGSTGRRRCRGALSRRGRGRARSA